MADTMLRWSKMMYTMIAAFLLVAVFAFDCATRHHLLKHPSTEWTKRDFAHWAPTNTAESLKNQFINPQGITAILLLIGGDIIAKAVAQLSCTFKNFQFTPVLFSYGWVSYSFGLIAGATGRGGYFPNTDYPGSIINLSSGDSRSIKSWVIGRLFRDLEKEIDPDGKIAAHKAVNDSLHVEVYQFDPTNLSNNGTLRPRRDALWWSFVVALFLQIGVAIIPLTPTQGREEPNFYILLITIAGTFLSLATGSLQATRGEKYGRMDLSCRQMFALTKGSGYNIAIIILPNSFAKQGKSGVDPCRMPFLADMATASYRPTMASRFRASVLAGLWIVLLLVIGGATEDSWYLLAVGGIGMIHTVLAAGMQRTSDAHGIPLKRLAGDWIFNGNAGQMEVLLNLEKKIPGAGYMLRRVLFNGPSTADDRAKWRKFLSVDELSGAELVAVALEQLHKRHLKTADELRRAFDGWVGGRLDDLPADAIRSLAIDSLQNNMLDNQKKAFLEHLLSGLDEDERMMRFIVARRETTWSQNALFKRPQPAEVTRNDI